VAIALAALSAIYVSPYGVLQALLLTAVVLAIGVQSIAGAEGQWRPETHPPVLRSRILHYARISKLNDGRRLQKSADNPFEGSLLGYPGWSHLTAKELKEFGRMIPEAGLTEVREPSNPSL
jgi:hypothetical protein